MCVIKSLSTLVKSSAATEDKIVLKSCKVGYSGSILISKPIFFHYILAHAFKFSVKMWGWNTIKNEMRTNLKKTFGYRFPLTRKLINFERKYQMVILTESEIIYLNTQQLISLTLTLLNSSFFRAWFSKHSHRLFDLLHSQLENIYEKKNDFP